MGSCLTAMAAVLPLLYAVPAARGAGPASDAERLAGEAVKLCADRSPEGLARARRALSLTADFEPTAYVTAGRKGEVVEDAYLAAREAYRRHRAGLYGAVGECHAVQDRPAVALRYLRRAAALDPLASAVPALGRALLALGRPHQALDAVLPRAVSGPLGAEASSVAQQAADAAFLPSLQAEIDALRLAARSLEHRRGPLKLPERARLSTGAPVRFEEGVTLVYVAPPSCRTCSADLETLRRLAPPEARVMMLPFEPDNDEALRRVLRLYRYDWPVALGPDLAQSLQVQAPSLLVVARRGWSAARLEAPFDETLPVALEALSRSDVAERVPRPAWNRRPVERPEPAPQPGLTPEGWAPGEDDPPPEAFARALAAYREGRAAEALRLVESLEAAGDGWLLPPEARLDRALCLAALGRREEARRLLLRTGDSRLQDAVDRALETVGSPPSR